MYITVAVERTICSCAFMKCESPGANLIICQTGFTELLVSKSWCGKHGSCYNAQCASDYVHWPDNSMSTAAALWRSCRSGKVWISISKLRMLEHIIRVMITFHLAEIGWIKQIRIQYEGQRCRLGSWKVSISPAVGVTRRSLAHLWGLWSLL